MGAKSSTPYGVLDIEGGEITASDLKEAREVAEEVLEGLDELRLTNLITDLARDQDTALTRATRDRDRATPRDVSRVENPRLRRELPAEITFRGVLSSRQRKTRSALKNRVLRAAPKSQRSAAATLLTEADSEAWQRVNSGLHASAGDVHGLGDKDRATVQRLDRLINAYERDNDRDHTVYVAVRLPEGHAVFDEQHLPAGLRPGEQVAFDQYSVAKHNLHELSGHDDHRIVALEVLTSRGMYMGTSRTGDTSHLLPRGMHLQLTGAHVAPYETPAGGYGLRLIVQARAISTQGASHG